MSFINQRNVYFIRLYTDVKEGREDLLLMVNIISRITELVVTVKGFLL
jgi:hypothetical protein